MIYLSLKHFHRQMSHIHFHSTQRQDITYNFLILGFLFTFQHHCRNCGKIFCNACSDNTIALPNSTKPVRVCDECHVFLVGRYSVVH